MPIHRIRPEIATCGRSLQNVLAELRHIIQVVLLVMAVVASPAVFLVFPMRLWVYSASSSELMASTMLSIELPVPD